jgi:hypothetical protein
MHNPSLLQSQRFIFNHCPYYYLGGTKYTPSKYTLSTFAAEKSWHCTQQT